jgi:hypothetical protein
MVIQLPVPQNHEWNHWYWRVYTTDPAAHTKYYYLSLNR